MRTGRIAPGARADLILLDGDPTTDITATRAIARTFKNGYEVARTRAAERPPAEKPALAGGLVSDFEAGLSSGFGVDWVVTTDQLAGGASSARLSRTANAALRVDGEVSTKFPFPWSGAGVFFSEGFTEGYDLTDYSVLRLRVRGAPRTLSVMFFTRTSRNRPAATTFEVDDAWGEYSFRLNDIRGLAPEEVYGFSIAAGRPKGPFHFELDDVRFE